MFNSSKYSKWYAALIERAQSRELDHPQAHERHHIIPKSLGGSNDASNIVSLTLREYYIAHRLLVRVVDEPAARSKMNYALHFLSSKLVPANSRIFERACRAPSAASRGRHVSQGTREKISAAARARGSAGTAAACESAAVTNRGRPHSAARRAAASAAQQGKKLSTAHRAAISAACQGRPASLTQRESARRRALSANPKRCEWILIDPDNKLIRTCHMLDFCTQHALAYSALRSKAQRGDSAPVRSGPSRGWSVFAVRACPKIPEHCDGLEPLSAHSR